MDKIIDLNEYRKSKSISYVIEIDQKRIIKLADELGLMIREVEDKCSLGGDTATINYLVASFVNFSALYLEKTMKVKIKHENHPRNRPSKTRNRT